MRLKSLSLNFIFVLIGFASARGGQPVLPKSKTFKDQFYIYWGYNRGWYTDSDIRFHGHDYDFTLTSVVAKDKQTPVAADPYLVPDKLTIPQTNFRVGYYFKDHWSISIGDDHMKYVMTQNQTAMINGTINLPLTEVGSQFNGTYNNQPVNLTDGKFLKFEHTNGLNYVYTEAAHYADISSLFGVRDTDIFQLNFTQGVGVGLLVPRTDATVLGKQRHDEFHISGYGFSADAGLNFTFFKHFYMQSEVKGGYINMTDVRTTYTNDHAQHHFWYGETIISFGGIFRL